MAASLTCDRCKKSSTRTASWLSVAHDATGHSMQADGVAISGDYCSAICLAAQANDYASACDRVDARVAKMFPIAA